jgi:hypothetical protein
MSEDNLLFKSISEANEYQMDALWAILKNRDIGILRKIYAMCEVLSLNHDDVVSNLPQDENGRIYDSQNRFLLSRALLKASNK